ncbi:uncharacterized protein LOC124446210 [Xenia sp. Carnegie-2017]|uniref:uncharacterized protein LOC124446210 n=1 Tax=Xenia sp. Carnegie-2017 TaxID=2897299 RepID=UPI001F04C5F7|nr:uncharacterized protein LOC124446210 [Xenia sp. Carnegie-2017]
MSFDLILSSLFYRGKEWFVFDDILRCLPKEKVCLVTQQSKKDMLHFTYRFGVASDWLFDKSILFERHFFNSNRMGRIVFTNLLINADRVQDLLQKYFDSAFRLSVERFHLKETSLDSEWFEWNWKPMQKVRSPLIKRKLTTLECPEPSTSLEKRTRKTKSKNIESNEMDDNSQLESNSNKKRRNSTDLDVSVAKEAKLCVSRCSEQGDENLQILNDQLSTDGTSNQSTVAMNKLSAKKSSTASSYLKDDDLHSTAIEDKSAETLQLSHNFNQQDHENVNGGNENAYNMNVELADDDGELRNVQKISSISGDNMSIVDVFEKTDECNDFAEKNMQENEDLPASPNFSMIENKELCAEESKTKQKRSLDNSIKNDFDANSNPQHLTSSTVCLCSVKEDSKEEIYNEADTKTFQFLEGLKATGFVPIVKQLLENFEGDTKLSQIETKLNNVETQLTNKKRSIKLTEKRIQKKAKELEKLFETIGCIKKEYQMLKSAQSSLQKEKETIEIQVKKCLEILNSSE